MNSFYYVYVLKSLKCKNFFYIGFTHNLKVRFNHHNEGLNKSTKPYRPFMLIFYEAFTNELDAQAREVYLKSGYGRRSLKKLLRYYLNKI